MEKIIAISIAVITYLLIIIFTHKKSYITSFFALLLIVLKIITPVEALSEYINWNVLLIYIGTLILAELFIYSKAPAYIADKLIAIAPNTGIAIVYICILTGFISAFVENVATVLVIAPVAFEVSRKLKFSPVSFLICIAISSNLQGTATLVGDPPSMIFAGFAKLGFNDFFFYKSKPGIFFVVESGAIVSFFVLYFIFRKLKKKVVALKPEKIKSIVPTILLILMILSLASISFFDKGFTIKSGIACMVAGIAGLLWFIVFRKKKKEEIFKLIKSLDWDTILFLIGIFIIIGAISKTGILNDLANFIKSIVGSNTLFAFIIIVGFSMVISGFVDNVPYIMIMLPVTYKITTDLGIAPELLMFGLLIGACLGGNITPYGASTNIVSVGLLRKRNYRISFLDFVKIGLPFTLITTFASALFIWIIWR